MNSPENEEDLEGTIRDLSGNLYENTMVQKFTSQSKVSYGTSHRASFVNATVKINQDLLNVGGDSFLPPQKPSTSLRTYD